MIIKTENHNNLYYNYNRKGSPCYYLNFPMLQKYLENPAFDDADWLGFYDEKCEYGLAYAVCIDDLEIENALHISAFEVAKPIRRKGYGKKVLNELINLAKETNYSYITLRVASPDLKDFYRKFGFVDWANCQFPDSSMIKRL